MTADEIRTFRAEGSWKTLERVAQDLVADAEHRAGAEMLPLLGGGTRLMLKYDHRISHDIDLFIRDPQWIGYLTPRLNDENGRFQQYDEQSNFLKIKLDEGEIDFIVGMSLLNLPSETAPETTFRLEPVAEVLAKKLFYRGASLTVRDVYDWWAVGTATPDVFHHDLIVGLLGPKVQAVSSSLDLIAKSPTAPRLWDALIKKDNPSLSEAVQWALDQIHGSRRVRFKPDDPCYRPS